MSNKLNNFWDDCLKYDDKSLNLFINAKDQNYSSLNSNRTKNSSSLSTNHLTLEPKKIKYKNFSKNKLNSKQRNLLLRYSSTKKEKSKKINKISLNNSDYNTRNKSNINSNSCLSSLELKLRKNLSECTFHPKLISKVKNKNLKEKLNNYSKFTMYERGQIFEMKKKEDKNRIYIQEYEKRNKKYPFKPKINKCPVFKNVVFNDSNYDSLNYFYSRMNSARGKKIYKSKKIPFGTVNYEEIYKNDSNFFKDNNNNNLSYIYGHNNYRNEYKGNKSFLMTKILNDKETELCKQNLHKALMNLQLNKNEL